MLQLISLFVSNLHCHHKGGKHNVPHPNGLWKISDTVNKGCCFGWLARPFHGFSGGCSVHFVQLWDVSTDSSGCHTCRYHTGTLSAIADMLPRFAKPKYLPRRGVFLPNRHLLKASSSAPFTVAELNMTYNYLILTKKRKKKGFPGWSQPPSLLVISCIKDSSQSLSHFDGKLVRFR